MRSASDVVMRVKVAANKPENIIRADRRELLEEVRKRVKHDKIYAIETVQGEQLIPINNVYEILDALLEENDGA